MKNGVATLQLRRHENNDDKYVLEISIYFPLLNVFYIGDGMIERGSGFGSGHDHLPAQEGIMLRSCHNLNGYTVLLCCQ